MLWTVSVVESRLKICPSNSNPCHVASLFSDCVKSNRGCARVLQTNCGTENVTMAAMQCYFSRTFLTTTKLD